MLDAYLEADGRVTGRQLVAHEPCRRILHHRDHPGRREHRHRQRAVHIGQQTVLDPELLGAFVARR
jgi:hypothetical protein